MGDPDTHRANQLRVCMLPWSAGNAYQQLLQQAVEARGASVIPITLSENWLSVLGSARADVLHLHWLHGLSVGRTIPRTLIKGGLFLRKLAAARRQAKGVVWTCHNLGNHLGWCLGLEKSIVRRACSTIDRIIVHHDSAIDEVISYFKIPHMRDRFDVIPHGHYLNWYPGTASQQEARRVLNIPEEDIVFLLFGQLRANKGIENLLSAFIAVREESQAPLRLVLAGSAEPQVAKSIANAQSAEPRVDFREGFVTEEFVQPFHAAADVAVFPYSTGLSSGSLILAMGFGLPVIAAGVGDAKHLVSCQGGKLIASGNVGELRTALKEMSLAGQEWAEMGHHNRQHVGQLSWDVIGTKTMDTYTKAIQVR